jgi:maltose O-acetyltransferase
MRWRRLVTRALGDARRDLFNRLQASPLVPTIGRWLLLRTWGADVSRCRIAGDCWFGSRRVSIGTASFVNYRCFFDAHAPITIGARTAVGMGVMFATSTHELGPHRERAGDLTSAPIVVGDGCWIGTSAVVLSGVTIGDGAVVAAGAVVVDDVEPDTVVGGVPARVLRRLSEDGAEVPVAHSGI